MGVLAPCLRDPAIAGSRQFPRPVGEGRAEREERDEGQPVLCGRGRGRPRRAVEQAVGVLDAGDVGQLDGLLGGPEGHVRDADQVELALRAERLELAELVGERHVRAAVAVHAAEVDEVHPLDAQRAQVVLDALAQLGRPQRREPGAVLVAAGADLRHQLQVRRVGVQRLPDQVVHDVRPVVLGGVDVVDAELDRAAQNGARTVRVAGGPNTRGPASCMAPRPMRLIGLSPRNDVLFMR